MTPDTRRESASLAGERTSQWPSGPDETVSVPATGAAGLPRPTPAGSGAIEATEALARSQPGPGSAVGPPAGPSAGGYQLLSRLGGGAFGEVWNARAPGGFPAAVKVIHRQLEDAQAQRELKSLEAIKELRHPYLLATHACWVEQGRLHIAMELADQTLRGRLRQCVEQGRPGIPPEELVRHFAEAAEALDFLHENNVLHRDIKPDNLLLLAGHVKVADFGLARLQDDGQTVESSMVCGTASYMAPEMWESICSERSDLYSLAVSYAELRLGRRPFGGSTVVELMRQHREGAPDLTGLPEAERVVLVRALASERGLRYGSCVEFVQALRSALAGQEPRPAIPAAAPVPGQPLSLMTLLLVAVVVGALALAAYFVYEHLPQSDQAPAAPVAPARPLD